MSSFHVFGTVPRKLFLTACVWMAGLALWAASAAAQTTASSAPVPDGYTLLYSQSFDDASTLGDFEFTNPGKWAWRALDAGGCLAVKGAGNYRPPVRSPHIIALVSGRQFGDFVLEADLLQTGREYGHRDMCLFFGLTSSSRFYYVHLATKADKNAHNIFIVNDRPRTNIATKTTGGIDWGKDVWHHVRIERGAVDGVIRVFFDDMTAPVMEARDTTFTAGLIGFGSFDDSGRFDNIRVWGPSSSERAETVFPREAGTAQPQPVAE